MAAVLAACMHECSTDVVADKALAQIVSAVSAGKPFFVQINPIAVRPTHYALVS